MNKLKLDVVLNILFILNSAEIVNLNCFVLKSGESKNGFPGVKNKMEMKIIAVTKSNGDKYLFSVERIEHFIKTQTGWDFKFKIVPVNTVTHGDCETP